MSIDENERKDFGASFYIDNLIEVSSNEDMLIAFSEIKYSAFNHMACYSEFRLECYTIPYVVFENVNVS